VNVVITGGDRGFGRTIARRFAARGATVVVTARDLTDPVSVRRCAEQVGDLLGHVDVLVDNGAAFLAESEADDDALEAGSRSDPAHAAFHAGEAGIRMISLYPPDFDNDDSAPRDGALTGQSVADCVLFAVNQPRDCFIRSFHSEPTR
jgi:NADP-dependent 3-hydroxy acid dehydrogenase YdfG